MADEWLLKGQLSYLLGEDAQLTIATSESETPGGFTIRPRRVGAISVVQEDEITVEFDFLHLVGRRYELTR